MLDDAPPGRVSSAPPSSVLPSAEELCAAIGPIWHYFGRSTPTDGAGALPCPGPAPRPLRRGERSQRVLSPEPGATPPLRVVGSRRADGDLVRRRTDAVALHAGGPAPPRCRSGAGDVHP